MVKLTTYDVAKLLETTGSPHSSGKQVWLAIPGQGALIAIDIATPLADLLSKRRRTTGALPSRQKEKVTDHIHRPPLDGGRLWCISPDCATCNLLETKITTSKGEISVGRTF